MNKRAVSKKSGRTSNNVRRLSENVGLLMTLFYENPSRRFTVREIANKIKMNRSTVQYQLKYLKNEGLVSRSNQWVDTWQNRLLKTNYYTEKITASGVVDYLEAELAASTVILFGSFRKGESVKESDIDIFVECALEKKVDLKKFEKKLGHNIQLFTKPKITLLPKRLLNNVVNGIKLKGYFTIK